MPLIQTILDEILDDSEISIFICTVILDKDLVKMVTEKNPRNQICSWFCLLHSNP